MWNQCAYYRLLNVFWKCHYCSKQVILTCWIWPFNTSKVFKLKFRCVKFTIASTRPVQYFWLILIASSFHPFSEASRRSWELHLRMQTKYINLLLLCFYLWDSMALCIEIKVLIWKLIFVPSNFKWIMKEIVHLRCNLLPVVDIV
jgi:hypothetical protein